MQMFRFAAPVVTVVLALSSIAQAQQAAQVPAARQLALALAPSAPGLKWGPCPALFPAGCQIAVLQGDPGKENADVFLRVPGKTLLPPHWHTSAEHMILVSGRLEVHYKGQASTTLNAGDYAYGPPKLPHLARCASKGPCQLFISFDLPVDAEPYAGAIP